jgi:hypothetical protein
MINLHILQIESLEGLYALQKVNSRAPARLKFSLATVIGNVKEM